MAQGHARAALVLGHLLAQGAPGLTADPGRAKELYCRSLNGGELRAAWALVALERAQKKKEPGQKLKPRRDRRQPPGIARQVQPKPATKTGISDKGSKAGKNAPPAH